MENHTLKTDTPIKNIYLRQIILNENMYRLNIILGLLLFIPIFLISQSINHTDANGNKQGEWKKTYANGQFKYKGQFKNDKPYGEFKHFYISGDLKAITEYSPDGVVAHTQTFHENQLPMAEGKYINHKKDGIWKFYNEFDGKLISEETYKNGKLKGISKTFYTENGNLAESIEYENGIKQGKLRKYFPEGSIMTEGNYENDLLNGDFTLYFPEGNTQLKGKYLKGRQIGNWQYFDEEGNAISEEEFKEED